MGYKIEQGQNAHEEGSQLDENGTVELHFTNLHVHIQAAVCTVSMLMIKRNEARVSTGVVKLMAKAWPELADDQQGRRIFS